MQVLTRPALRPLSRLAVYLSGPFQVKSPRKLRGRVAVSNRLRRQDAGAWDPFLKRRCRNPIFLLVTNIVNGHNLLGGEASEYQGRQLDDRILKRVQVMLKERGIYVGPHDQKDGQRRLIHGCLAFEFSRAAALYQDLLN